MQCNIASYLRDARCELDGLFYDSWQRGHLLHCALTSLTSVLMVEATLHDLASEEHYDQYCGLIKLNASLFLPTLMRCVQLDALHRRHLDQSDVMQKHISRRRVIKWNQMGSFKN